jgi:thioredoxin-related protein
MKQVVLAVLLATFMAGAGAATLAQGQPESATRVKFDPKRDPERDLAAAVKSARKENRRILLDVGGEWCGWCHKLDNFFATNLEAKQLLKDRYVVVKVNFSPENKNEKFLAKYPKIVGYPHLFVLDKDGKLIHSQDTGLLETGPNHDAAKVVPFLRKWAG